MACSVLTLGLRGGAVRAGHVGRAAGGEGWGGVSVRHVGVRRADRGTAGRGRGAKDVEGFAAVVVQIHVYGDDAHDTRRTVPLNRAATASAELDPSR